MKISRENEIIKRLKDENPNHIFSKFLLNNFGKFVRIGEVSGTITGTNSNKDCFKFGIQMAVEDTQLGEDDYIDVSITNKFGELVIDPMLLQVHNIDQSIAFQNYEKEDYIDLKKYVMFLASKGEWHRAEMKKMDKAGFKPDVPYTNKVYKKSAAKKSAAKKVKEDVPAFIVEVDIDDFEAFEGSEYEMSEEKYASFKSVADFISYTQIPQLNFFIRCIEVGMKENETFLAEGIDHNFKQPRKRIVWHREENYIDGVDLRYRDFTVKA